MYDVAVIGCGAAGLTAAIFAARSGARVVALDGAAKLGAKILIAGGGRCNVTHDLVTPDDFNGSRNAIAKVLRSFTVSETVAWFDSMGVKLKREEGGKLFPVTDRARTVLDALLQSARAAGVEIRAAHRVTGVEPGFTVHTGAGPVAASRVILATGGRSVPKSGSDGAGFELARLLGHSVTPLFPALVPLLVGGEHWTKRLSGTACDAELSVTASTGRTIARSRGAMLFTHFGVSGPAVLDISRHWIAARRDDAGAGLAANFLPGETFDSLDAAFLAAGRANPRATTASALRGRMPERLLDVLAPAGPLSSLTREERRDIVRLLISTAIPAVRDRGFDFAEVTAGGVPLDEVKLGTMESRRCERLFLCGEMLDVDGRIGGYNFQWAWASGRLAGLAAGVTR